MPSELKPTTKAERERWADNVKRVNEGAGVEWSWGTAILRLIADVNRYRKELACAAISLLGYEQSHGTGRGDEEAYDIARLLGYEEELAPDAVRDWLLEIANAQD